MENLFIVFIIAAVAVVFYSVYRKSAVVKRSEVIDSYQFPASISDKVREKYPHLTDQQLNLVIAGLREYFHICNLAGRKMVSMPSEVVDVAWHEFILFTKNYQQFCHGALGRFLHHIPAEAMNSATDAQKGIKRAWQISCKREHIAPKTPLTLPLLFAMDDKLAIPDGFIYSRNCKTNNRKNANNATPAIAGAGIIYCAGDIGCSSGCGGGGCGGDSGGGDGGGSGCGGGD
ncbi:MAG: hypothetical protein ACI8WB_001783 [Phenylobacterium sp.]|jgi:hypothetical protein